MGLIGALTGMSAEGLTVHEANLEELREVDNVFLFCPHTHSLILLSDILWDALGVAIAICHGSCSQLG